MKRTVSLLICLPLFLFCLCPPAMAQTDELDDLMSQAKKAVKRNQLSQADSLYNAYVALYNEQGIDKGYKYCEVLIWLAQYASKHSQIDKAIGLQKEVVEVCNVAKDCNPAQRATAISELSTFYVSKGNYSNAIEAGTQAVEAMARVYGEKNHYYSITLLNLAVSYSARGKDGDAEKAVELGERAIKHMKKTTAEYTRALNSMVIFYTQKGDLVAAARYSAKARRQASNYIDISKDGVNYATQLNNTAIRLAKLGSYDEAIENEKMACEYIAQSGGVNTLLYGKLLMNLGIFYAHQQRFQESIAVLQQALPILENTVTKHHQDYVRCVSELSSVYRNSGNLDKAKELAEVSEEVSSELGEVDNIRYAKSLSKQAAIFASNGNFSRAIECEQEALHIFATRRDTMDMAFSMAALANFHFSEGKMEEGLQTIEQALDFFRLQGKKNIYYAQTLNNAAILYYKNNDYKKASEYGNEALAMYQELGDTANIAYARILANNALFDFMADSLTAALQTAERALALNQQVLGKEHFDNVPFLYNLAVYQMRAELLPDAEKNYTEALHLQSLQVKKDFLHLTTKEREKYWKQHRYVYRMAPMLAYIDRGSLDMNEEAYNTLLFSKGILLNSDIDFRNLLRRSEDKGLLDTYNQLLQLRHDEEVYYKQPASIRNMAELKGIQEQIYKLENSLVRGCKEYGSFTESLSITAEEIARSLKKDEAAVEFAHLYIHGIGVVYAALVLTKDNPKPRFIRLFTEDDLDELQYMPGISFRQTMKSIEGINLIYDDQRFGTLVWKPIIDELQGKGVKHIYFSPTAMLYHVGIEYMYCDETHRIQDLYQVSRLSSTKMLVHRQAGGKMENVAIYGGLNYDMSLDELYRQHQARSEQLMAYVEKPQIELSDKVDERRAIDSLSMRGSIHYLQGTMRELENIALLMQKRSVAVSVLSGDDGTEESFKALSGTNLSVIHIATHGFSYSREEVLKREQPLAFLNEETDDLNNPLNYSGLLMAGVNYVLKGNKMPEDLEDGVLTANEISKVDLGNVGLVVLSACQTALGEIQDDGVFGLQRGFKKAGAQSLLMSLWKVDDEATGIMMTQFYKSLLDGCSRHEAFSLAQQAVRNNPQTSDPYYWASFILLDSF